jgi:hypothetical protein
MKFRMSRKMGMPVKVCQVQGMNLDEAKYHIKTMLGTSVSYIIHCEKVLHGMVLDKGLATLQPTLL